MLITRKNVSLTLFTLLIISRGLDILATWYYSPDLLMEGNQILLTMVGASWSKIFLVQIAIILVLGFYCIRLAKHNYKKPLFDEKLLNTLFNKKLATQQKRYSNEFSSVFSIIFAGFVASLIWIAAHGYQMNLINNFLNLGMLSMFITIGIGWIIGKLIYTLLLKKHLENNFKL